MASLTCGGTSGAPVTLSVVDSVTGAVLGTASIDAGLGFGLLAWFTPTTTDPVVLQVSAARGTNTNATIVVDYVQVTRTSAYGIDMSNRTGTTITSSAAGGSIVQGTGVSYGSYPINAYGTTGSVINGIALSASGEDTSLIYGDWADGITITNDVLTASVNQISDRMSLIGFIDLWNTSGAIDVVNNSLSGSQQSGIVVYGGGGASSFTSITIENNSISQNSSWTDGYGIELSSWVQNFNVSGNTIDPTSGRGILLDDLATGGFIQNGSIYNNNVNVQERPDLEYGATGLEVTAFRMRDEGEGSINNIQVYNNTFYAHTGLGLDWAAIGARFTLYNVDGQMNNSNIVISNNTFEAIVLSDDPTLRFQDAYAIDLARFDAGMGILFENNNLVSNDISLNLGSNDGINESDVSFIGNTLTKSSLGTFPLATSDYETRGYVSVEAGNYDSTISNVRLIDTKYAGGATSAVNYVGTAPKSISFS